MAAMRGSGGSFGDRRLAGAPTTFSTFSYETVRLAQAGVVCRGSLIVLSLTSAYAAPALGWRLAF